MLGLQIRDFLLQRVEAVLLLIELTGITLQESFFLRRSLERLHVFADTD